MNKDELREACTLAGGELEYVQFEKYGLARVPVWNFPSHKFGMHEDHPMLLAAVAEIVMGMLREKQSGQLWHEYERLLVEQHETWPLLAPAVHRTQAATSLLRLMRDKT